MIGPPRVYPKDFLDDARSNINTGNPKPIRARFPSKILQKANKII